MCNPGTMAMTHYFWPRLIVNSETCDQRVHPQNPAGLCRETTAEVDAGEKGCEKKKSGVECKKIA